MHSNVTPALLDKVIAHCRQLFVESGHGEPTPAEASVLASLTLVRDHLVMLEHHDLGEWVRDIPPDKLPDFLGDMEGAARQADAESDIGTFISALADWQTTAEAHRNNW